MQSKRRLIAIVLISIMLLGQYFSYAYILDNMHHQCSGLDCQVCEHMFIASKVISTFKFTPILFLVISVMAVFLHVIEQRVPFTTLPKTLISLKVELLI